MMRQIFLRISIVLELTTLGLVGLLAALIGVAVSAHTSAANAAVLQANSLGPTLLIQPDAITFTAHISYPALQTRTIQIYNTDPSMPMTWTITVNPSGTLQPLVSPVSGVDTGTLTVQIDTSPFTVTGTYTGAIRVSAEPTTTLGSPITIGVNLVLTDQFNRVYLPLVDKNFNASAPPPLPITTTRFGFNFISSAEARAAEIRYQRAAEAGASLNRWPFYWYAIEQNPLSQPGVFSWAWQDENTINDIHHGLTIDAILIGTPPGLATGGSASIAAPQVGQGANLQSDFIIFRQDAMPHPPTPSPEAGQIASEEGELHPPLLTTVMLSSGEGPGVRSSAANPPQGLYLSVFSDGTDTPGSGKSINPNNRWARFVYAAVNRYKPGGVLAQQQGWTNGQGIRVWEIWNEPDLGFFFSGTVTDYARLLKVAFLATRHADPNAQILFGGLANFEKPNWLRDTLNVIATYPDRDANEWFFDSVAVHNYVTGWNTFYHLYRARVMLDSFGLTDKTLWLNEAGVAVWDDPPGPVNDPNSLYRATMQEQAAFTIQAATFAVWLRTEAMLIFQLYDDFGNGCPGIDAYGLVRNVPNAPCNPGDGTPRPAHFAYQVVTRYFTGVSPYWRKRPTENQELIALQNPETGERVISMWARDTVTETAVITATASSAMLVYPNGITETLVPLNGVYTLTLPMATNTNTPTTDGKAPIGGAPRILIERDPAIAITP